MKWPMSPGSFLAPSLLRGQGINVGEERGLWIQTARSNPSSVRYSLCDLGQVTEPL